MSGLITLGLGVSGSSISATPNSLEPEATAIHEMHPSLGYGLELVPGTDVSVAQDPGDVVRPEIESAIEIRPNRATALELVPVMESAEED
jgi:hypothetical protein